MPDILLLDTHALLWWQAGGERLSRRARSGIDGATTLMVSPISFWEISMLVEKGRIGLDRSPVVWANDLLATDGLATAELTPTIAATAGTLQGFHGDPADRLIVATARSLGVPIVTKDAQITSYCEADARSSVVW